MNYRKNSPSMAHVIAFPFIWMPFFAIILLDILISLYHFVCFPLYGIEKVKRSEYVIIFDRNRLDYLNPLEKLFCMYCGYVNGFLLYAKEISGRTEKYWCGVMHDDKSGIKSRRDQTEMDFSRFGDAEDFHEKYGKR